MATSAGAGGLISAAAQEPGPRLEWLDWNGRALHWRMTAAIPTAAELRIDGVTFQRFDAAAPGASAVTCEFEFSPTGNAELEFSVGVPGSAAIIGVPWRVRFDAAAPGGLDQWQDGPRYLAPLADTPQLPRRAWSRLPDVAVIVPIHNAPDSVSRCLAALVQWTPTERVRLILIDDASTDPAIAPLLRQYAQTGNVHIECHAQNRGYTYSVNAGLALAGDADAVLLNSDTEVGPRWLESLRLAAHGDDSVGTVTAVSDNAGAFSVPELEHYCPIPERWDLPTAQRAVLQQAGLRFPELPTGNGFCMFIKRDVIARIGPMDADAFPSGYGEENDFCQRAIQAGYRNIIAGNTLVRHQRSASFGDARRAALGDQGMAVLRKRYPSYEADVGATLYSFTRRVLDYRVRRTYADSDGRYADRPPRPRVLMAISAGDDLRAAFAAANPAQEALVVQRRSRLQLYRIANDGTLAIVATGDTAQDRATVALCLQTWLLVYAIEQVSAPNAGDLGRQLVALAAELGIPAPDADTPHTATT
jgi:GT2 family glycosyltransferase